MEKQEEILGQIADMNDEELEMLAGAMQQIKSKRAAGNENAGMEDQEETKETLLEKLKTLRDNAKDKLSEIKTKVAEKTDQAVGFAKENPVKVGLGATAILTAVAGVAYLLFNKNSDSTEE